MEPEHLLESLFLKSIRVYPALRLFVVLPNFLFAQGNHAQNPVIYADVPDLSVVCVGDAYYMSSTTMHMSPGVPIMKSEDLVNWKIVAYAYDVLDPVDDLSLENGKSTYGKGSWASCIRHYAGVYYVSTFAQTTGKTYIYSTKDIEKGPWKASSFAPAYHDHTLFFDDDGRIYMIWGGGKLSMVELREDLTGVKEGTERVLIENASAPAGPDIGLPAEGSQLFKINGKYYLFNIVWPKGGMRTVVVHRADQLKGPYEGRVALQDKGVAQGGLIHTPENDWYAYLFRDYGAVGRTPYLVPVKWEDDWPVLGINGEAPDQLNLLPPGAGLMPGIVASDDFKRKKSDKDLPLVWQWNHNPDNSHWSVRQRKGYLRLTTGRVDHDFLLAKNTLTQRTIGPECSGTVAIDVSGMKNGDFAGLALLQKQYGWVGVKMADGKKYIVMINADSGNPVEEESIPLHQKTIYLMAEGDFSNRKDVATFSYSFDEKNWTRIGTVLKMAYTIPHFMGYRFGLFNYATETSGGYVDFDYFHILDKIRRP